MQTRASHDHPELDSGRFDELGTIFRNGFFACMGMHYRIATTKGKTKIMNNYSISTRLNAGFAAVFILMLAIAGMGRLQAVGNSSA